MACLGISPTGLSPATAGLSRPFGYPSAVPSSAVLQPRVMRRHTRGLGSCAFARHYLRNHCYFLLLRVMRCFSSPGLPPTRSGAGSDAGGLPHSEIRASRSICLCARLIAAYHVLRRLQEPRHPSCALISFLFIFRLINSCRSYLRHACRRRPACSVVILLLLFTRLLAPASPFLKADACFQSCQCTLSGSPWQS